MASTSIEDFVGNGSLKEILPKLLKEGWDDVLTLKVMNSEDMADINMTQEQEDALEIRSYLHDHSLMQYGDKLEASGKCLPELLNLDTSELSSQFDMKRGHVARFRNRTSECSEKPSPASITLPERQREIPSTKNNKYKRELMSASSRKLQSARRIPLKSNSIAYSTTSQRSLSDFKLKDDHIYKGIVAAMPDEPRGCGCVLSPSIAKNVAPYSTIHNISVQKLTPEYKNGMEHLIKTKTPPMKASELWCHKPAVLLLTKSLFHAGQVKDFWPRYWSGAVIQFIERNFGDWAPLAEVIGICTQLQVLTFTCFFSASGLPFSSTRFSQF